MASSHSRHTSPPRQPDEEKAGETGSADAGQAPSPAEMGDPIAQRFVASRWWTILPEMLLVVLTGILPIIVLANVIARYTNWFHVIWAEDIVKVLFLWIVFLGGAVGVKYEAHVRMTMLSDRIGRLGTAGRWWERAVRFSPILVGLTLVVLGIRIVEISMLRELPTLRISSGYFATIVPISGVMMVYYVLRQIYAQVRRPAPSDK